jgi:N-acetylneuraminic acid mutarotase
VDRFKQGIILLTILLTVVAFGNGEPGRPVTDGSMAYDNGVVGSWQTIGTLGNIRTPHWAVAFDSFPGTIESVSVYCKGEVGHNDEGFFQVYADAGGLPGARIGDSIMFYVDSSQGWRSAFTSRSVTTRFHIAVFPYWVSSGHISQGFDNNGVQAPSGSQSRNTGTWSTYTGAGDIMIRCFVRRHDVGARRIFNLPLSIDSGLVIQPYCSLYNYGDYEESYAIRMKIGSFYDRTAMAWFQQPKSWLSALMPRCTVNFPLGTYPVTCSTTLASDANLGNNRCSTSIEVLPGNKDVSVTKLIAPLDTLVYGTTVTPACSVYNWGNRSQDYNVAMYIGTTTLRVGVVAHAPGTLRYVTFPNWRANQPGSLTVRCSTELVGDRVPSNDRRTGMVHVRSADVGVTRVLAPSGTIETTDVIVPACTVRNFGTETAEYIVRLKVSGYTDTVRVLSHAPGTRLYVTFPSCAGWPRGSHTVSCSTELSGDNEPANDRAATSLVVEVHDAGARAIVEPAGALPINSTLAPKARFRNSGDIREPVLVAFRINTTPPYSSTRNLGNGLPPGVDTVINFSSWTAANGGIFVARCSIYMPGDRNPRNDTLSQSFAVGNADAGVAQIVRPNGAVEPGRLAPEVRVRNNGELTMSFPVSFHIWKYGSLRYADTQQVASLAPASERTVCFDSVDLDTGQYATKARLLSADGNPANDSLVGSATCANVAPGWNRLTDVPLGSKSKNVKDGGCLAYYDGRVYELKGNGRCEFYSYDISSKTWTTLESIPIMGSSGKKKPVKKGGSLSAVAGKVYATKGNGTTEFWQFDPATGHWTEKTGVPAGTKALKEGTGAAGVILNDTGYVYLLKGSATQEFYRYNSLVGIWEARANAPAGVSGKGFKDGSCLAFDGTSSLYCLKGSYNELFAYDLAGNTWTDKTAMPLTGSSGKKKKVKSGAGLAVAGGRLYGLKGGGTSELWDFSSVWTQLADMPEGGGKPVKGGGALTASPSYVYAQKGNNTCEFYVYVPSGMDAAAARTATTSASDLPLRSATLAVAPSPASRRATLRYGLAAPALVRVRVCDIAGNVVRVLETRAQSPGMQQFGLDVTDLVRGVYVVRLDAGMQHLAAKLVLE